MRRQRWQSDFFWIGLAALVATYTRNKGRNGVRFFFLSLLLSPLIGLLIVALGQSNREKMAERSGLKKCPDCAEFVQPEARICRFCGHEFLSERAGNLSLSVQLRPN